MLIKFCKCVIVVVNSKRLRQKYATRFGCVCRSIIKLKTVYAFVRVRCACASSADRISKVQSHELFRFKQL